jgi:demethylmenaquinone methyltransferase/2-methoxy-6-polyprenyl-1,4-benzoquinol methylase
MLTDGPMNLAPMAALGTHLGKHVHQVARAFREGGGVPYSEYRPEFTDVMDSISRVQYDGFLVDVYVPLVPGLRDRLEQGIRVADIACGTGLNFPLIEEVIGPDGRIVGVDLTDAMLARAQDRIETNGWSNISLVEADAADFEFPTEVEAILSTYALSQVPECAEVIAHGAAALSGGGRWVVLDLKVPDNTPRLLAQLGTAIVRRFASIDEWIMRHPWEAIREAMQEELADVSWTELFFGTAFLAAGSRP